tara:strand:- start:49 stop:813 length:765 start_codon:yes stop_codon:yes gene_type:complete
MKTPVNEFKRRLAAGAPLDGLWVSLASPIAAEAVSLLGFDWMLFDTEHCPIDLAQVQPLLQAAATGTASAVLRPAWNDKVLIKRALDMGAQTLLIPFVQTPEEAAEAVAATRYPPDGIRGVAGATRASRYGQASDYFAQADSQIAVLVQVEARAAMDRLEDIAAVPGVDGVFIGPSDLAASYGHLGNPGHPEMQAVLEQAVQRLQAVGKPAGILATNAADAKRYRGWGYAFVAGAVDLGLLIGGAKALLAEMRD